MVEGRGSIFKRMGWEAVTGKECLRRHGGGEGGRDPYSYQGLDQGRKCKRRLQKGKLVEIISCLVGQQHKDSE